MGTLRGDNGGGQPPNGGGLPDLPPEWGVVIIPDDAAELDVEAAQVHRELRWYARGIRWRRRFHLPVPVRRSPDGTTLGLPLLIMAIAIIATLTSLFALAWPSRASHSSTGATQRSSTRPDSAPLVPDLTLTSADGTPVQLRNSLPAVLLLADGCSCADLELATARAVPPGVTVLAIGRTAPAMPSAQPIGLRIRSVADPDSRLRQTYGGSPPADGVIAVLIKGTGQVVRKVPGVTRVSDFAADLPQLS